MTLEQSEEFPSLDEIDSTEDLFGAVEICEDHNVQYDELEETNEIKERLKLEYWRRKGISVKKDVQDAMQRTSDEDAKKRLRLTQMFEELVQIIGAKDESKRIELVKDLLQKDKTSGNLLGDCESNIESLNERECVILVAGETSAGKSSFLNLLLGSEFLPTHTCSCTSSITTLRYGTQKQARIIYGGPGSKVDVIENLDKEGMEKLYSITFMKGKEREEGHDVKEVQVYLPIEFLKCGIVLADTPGIGENEFLESYLMDFISNNQILGFVYIIFSDSAGGVQEDRLLLLLKMIIEQQKKNSKALKFDPKAALFLANRFDAVPEESREKVKKHILGQLGKYWPEFEESMAVFFSTKKALRDVDAHPDYINEEYKTLLTGISNLFSLAMDRRIRSSYKWIEAVLQRINHYLKTTVTSLGMTQRENQDKSLRQEYKLQNLKERSNTVISELTADIAERSEHIIEEVQRYLSTPQAKFLLCSVWREEEIPKLEDKITDQHHWHWVKQRIDEAFYDRLCNAIEEWDDENCNVSSIEAEIVENIKSKLGVLQEEISEVEHDLRSTNTSTGSTESRSRRLTMVMSRSPMVDVPLKLALNMQHRISNNTIGKMMYRRESEKFEKDPHAWAKKRAEKLMEKLLKNTAKNKSKQGMLTQLVEQLMQRPRDIVMRLELHIPSIIDTNLQLLNSLQHLVLSEGRHAIKYEQMMVLIEGLKQSLMNYGEGYIFVNDFKSNEIKVLQDTPTGQSLAQTFRFSELVTGRSTAKSQFVKAVPQGLWTVIRPGTLHRDGKERQVSIKMYMPSSGVSHTFQEVAKLRCLLHKDVYLAEFLGIHHTEAVTPAYIFNGHLQPLQKFVLDCTNPRSHFPRLFREIADGVHYLHSKGMVHMELNSSTVTVTESGEVRMTGACVPRHATLPLDKENTVSDFVYLAPEVLKNELYITPADVYGFGLLVYEIVSERKAFQEQRKTTFKEFVERISPVTMLHLNTHAQNWLSENALLVVKQCLEISENKRPNMNVVIEMLGNIKSDFKPDLTGRRMTEMHTPGEVFRRSRGMEKNTH
ncbi:uncharacterized protein LOC123529920 isoform X2 [Mercenaria mercenaria]|nr:uncharacterized protein LOC123529920 isoform X2 [Mercenaria mercenaria]